MTAPKVCNVREQVFEDPVSGLTVQFEVDPDGLTRLRLYGDGLKFGNRDFIFGTSGLLGGSGTACAGSCRPTVLVNLDDL